MTSISQAVCNNFFSIFLGATKNSAESLLADYTFCGIHAKFINRLS
jgi:hypothetical protein